MEHIIFLYVFFTGCVFASWMFETTDIIEVKLMKICLGFVSGWLITPILIGRSIKRIYND